MALVGLLAQVNRLTYTYANFRAYASARAIIRAAESQLAIDLLLVTWQAPL